MASVTRPHDRGQLILVAGLTVAVILVMLVLLLNTVIYTENLATRGIDSGAAGAIEYRATVVGSVEELIKHENERYDEGHTPKEGVKIGIGEINKFLGERYLYRGTIAEVQYDVGYIEEDDGPIAWQDGPRDFTGASEEPNFEWTVMTGAANIEQFIMTVNPNEFTGSPFRIIVGGWTMEIDVVTVENGTEERLRVTVNGEEKSPYLDGEPLEIDLVTGSIETPSETISIAPVTANDDEIRYENGDWVTGTYKLHADGTPNEAHLTEANRDYTYTVESVDLTVHYETSELRFVTEETIGPEVP